MTRLMGLKEMIKASIYYAFGFLLPVIGVVLISQGLGTDCPPWAPPTCYPIPPNPTLTGIGAVILATGLGILFFYGVYWYAIKWQQYTFINVVFRSVAGSQEWAETIVLDDNDVNAEVELTPRLMNQLRASVGDERLPATLYGHRLSYWLLRDSDTGNLYVLGAIARPSTLPKYELRSFIFKGRFVRARIGFIEADVYVIGARHSVEEALSIFGYRFFTDVVESGIPVAVVTGSRENTMLRAQMQADPAAFSSIEEAMTVFQTIAREARFAITDLMAQERAKYRSSLDALLGLLRRGMRYDVIAGGVPIYQEEVIKKPIQVRRIIKIALIVILLAIGAIITIILLNMFGILGGGARP